MAVLDHSEKQKIVTSTLLSVLLIAIGLLCLMLVASSVKLGGVNNTGSTIGAIGPLKLFEVTKRALPGGGFGGGFSFMQSGILTYLGASLLTGFLIGTYRASKTR